MRVRKSRTSILHKLRNRKINRRLRGEQLEDRRMLATVTTLADVVDADDSVLSLREAITEAVPNEVIDFLVDGTIILDSALGLSLIHI